VAQKDEGSIRREAAGAKGEVKPAEITAGEATEIGGRVLRATEAKPPVVAEANPPAINEAKAPEVAAKEAVSPPSGASEAGKEVVERTEGEKAAVKHTEGDKAAASPQARVQPAEVTQAQKVADQAEIQQTTETAREEERKAATTERDKAARSQPAAQEALRTATLSDRAVKAASPEAPAGGRFDAESAPAVRSYTVGGITLHEVTDQDTLMGEGDLNELIAAWTAHIEENPSDSLASDGCRQVATAYCLLAKKTRDGGVASEGARVIHTYLDRAKSPAVRDFLAAKLAEIQNLQKE
jgi:hypothetical protein